MIFLKKMLYIVLIFSLSSSAAVFGASSSSGLPVSEVTLSAQKKLLMGLLFNEASDRGSKEYQTLLKQARTAKTIMELSEAEKQIALFLKNQNVLPGVAGKAGEKNAEKAARTDSDMPFPQALVGGKELKESAEDELALAKDLAFNKLFDLREKVIKIDSLRGPDSKKGCAQLEVSRPRNTSVDLEAVTFTKAQNVALELIVSLSSKIAETDEFSEEGPLCQELGAIEAVFFACKTFAEIDALMKTRFKLLSLRLEGCSRVKILLAALNRFEPNGMRDDFISRARGLGEFYTDPRRTIEDLESITRERLVPLEERTLEGKDFWVKKPL